MREGLMMDDYPLSLTAVAQRAERFSGKREVVFRRPDGTRRILSASAAPVYDADGRIDLFLVNWFQGNHCRLLHNESPPQNWLDVRVVGKKMNKMAIGATAMVALAINAPQSIPTSVMLR